MNMYWFVNCIDAPFVLNELPYFKKFYPNGIIITFKATKSTIDFVKNKYNLEIVQVNTLNGRILISKYFYKQIFSKVTIREFKNKIFLKKNFIKKTLYMLYYMCACTSIMNLYEDEFLKKDNLIYSYWFTKTAYIASFLKTINKRNCVFSRAHGTDIYEELNVAGYLPFRTFISDSLDYIFPISNSGNTYLKNNYKLHQKTFVFRLGVSPYNLSIKTRGIDDCINIASCSYVIPIKRIDLIIDKILEMQKSGFNIKWYHLGDGNQMDEIKNIARKKLKLGTFEFLGWIDKDKVRDVLVNKNINFLINMSDSEGIPVTMMEAQSLGIPILARDVGGINEIVDNNNGFIINNIYENIDMNELIRLYSFKTEMSYQSWNKRYNSEENYKKFYLFLSDIFK